MQTKYKRIINMLFYHESWDIMIIKDNASHTFPTNTLDILNRTPARQLKKKYTFQADPFIIERNNKVYIFYEALSFRNSRGILRCRILDADLAELDDVKLDGFDYLKCHLSFPFIFEVHDQLFMIPESSERKEVTLFQCVDFPQRWKAIKVLISGVALTDNVFFSLNGACYLLSTTMNNELMIHTAEHVSGPWRKITPTLQLSNLHQRGAGAPHNIDSKMYFLTQECTPETYGKSIYIKELVTLNAFSFDEKLIAQVNATINQSDGVHTLNFTNNYLVYDSKINTFSFLSILKKISYKCMVKFRILSLTRRHS
ncbi:hypothetical protein [Citrobacter sp. Res13-Sevr-PEB04-36]|uniref:glucosamine inositolphosphorylceramide transferase family protein n=1 Tax=Citrobacter sp. Res13-Sevr-PEB04-36 TaxID=2777960 RepID=UPI0018ACB270|nr:hypothetical protein [Citrobacter sp. Res13-Sevr-PEB04-36]